jgi:hypothetical protein
MGVGIMNPFETVSFDACIGRTTSLTPIPDLKGERGLWLMAGICAIGATGAVALGSVLSRNRWQNDEQLKNNVIKAIREERSRG